MKKDQLDQLFERLQNDFDLEDPNTGHDKRFLSKLNALNDGKTIRSKRNIWRPFIGIAASLAILMTVFVNLPEEDQSGNGIGNGNGIGIGNGNGNGNGNGSSRGVRILNEINFYKKK